MGTFVRRTRDSKRHDVVKGLPMARTRKRKSAPAKSATHAPESRWSALTWDDLSRWAGSRSVARGRKYQRGGNVTDLALAADGQLLASVMGTKRYITSVGFASAQSRSRRLQSTCTCPVGHDGCKHAVAVVAEYLETLANESAVPAADAEDPRWLELSGETLGVDDELDDLGNETGAFGADETGGQGAGAHRTKRRTRTEWDEKIEAHIRAKDHEALTDLGLGLARRGELEIAISCLDSSWHVHPDPRLASYGLRPELVAALVQVEGAQEACSDYHAVASRFSPHRPFSDGAAAEEGAP